MRKIAVFTGNRAEYDLLYPVIRHLQKLKSEVDLQLFVSGAHLDDNFGSTVNRIREQGFDITEEILIDQPADSLYGTSYAIGSGVMGVAKALDKWRPEIIIVYGDRFEGFAAVIAASQMGIPVAHIEGGDITDGGALDDNMRHAMSKLSHLHFTTNEQGKNVVLSMGEEPWRVLNSGLPSIDCIVDGDFATEEEITEKFKVDLSKPVVVFTQHSVTIEFEESKRQILPTLEVISEMAKEGVQFLITYPNNDAGGMVILEELKRAIPKIDGHLQLISAMGGYFYHGVLALAKNPKIRIACLGNSSSGIKETPVFGCPTVNIGSRQDGRLRGENLIDVPYNKEDIEKALRTCLFDNSFREKARNTKNPYGDGNATKTICDVILSSELGDRVLKKKHAFHI